MLGILLICLGLLRHARLLFGTRWNELWRLPLAEVRGQLGLAVA